MNIIVLSAGSSSIKYQVSHSQSPKTETPGAKHPVFSGHIEHLHEAEPIVHRWRDGHIQEQSTFLEISQGEVGIAVIFDHAYKTVAEHVTIEAVGHRVVHGGRYFSKQTLINTQVFDALQDMIPIAPLHNPSNISGIEQA